MKIRRRAGTAALVAALLAGGCADDGGDRPRLQAPSLASEDQEAQTEDPRDHEDHSVLEEPRSEDQPGTVTSSPGYAAEPNTGGKGLGPYTAGPLRFDRVFIERGPDGEFSGRTNVKNRSDEYLNDVTFTWTIHGPNGVLDSGASTWPNLAPGETATVELDGSADFQGNWKRVRFRFHG